MSNGTISERILVLVKASRVPGWCFGPILYTIGVMNSGILPRTVPAILCTGFQVFCISFPLCIVVFGVNDVYDYASDAQNPRKQGWSLEGCVLEPTHHEFVLASARVASALIFFSSFFNPSQFLSSQSTRPLHPPTSPPPSPSPSVNFTHPIITSIILILGWQYSSPPLRLKERPILDSLSNGTLVWLCWALGYTSSSSGSGSTLDHLGLFGSNIHIPDTSEGTSTSTFNKGWLLALCTSGVHALGAAADIEVDIATGQKTIATRFGKRAAAGFSVLLYFIASRTVAITSPDGIYTLAGTGISLIPVFRPERSHQAFKAIVYFSVFSASVWIGGKALLILLS